MDDDKLSEVDDFVCMLSLDDVRNFVKLIMPCVKEVKNELRSNWRHDVYTGKPVFMDNSRLRKHHLMSLSLDIAEFADEIIDEVMSLIEEPNNLKVFSYHQTVVLPTILYWMIIGLAFLDAGETRYYLANGGKRNAEKALKEMERKACMYRLFSFFA